MNGGVRLYILLAAWLFCAAPTAWAQAVSAPPVSADGGRALFLGHATGEVPAPLAILRGSGVSVPAERFACANCHGRNGRGEAEGAVRAPAIRWQDLARPSALRTAAYDAGSLRRALADGIDPGGRVLDRLMPGYTLTDPQLKALIAYLGDIDDEQRIGFEPETIRLGVLSQPSDDGFDGRLAEALKHAAVTPIFGRRIELVPLDLRSDAYTGERLRQARIVAAVGLPQSSQEAWPELRRLGIASIFPRALLHGGEPKDDVIGLLPTLGDIGSAGLDRAAECTEAPLTIVVSDHDQVSQKLAVAAQTRAATRTEMAAPVIKRISELIQKPAPSTSDCILVFADPEEVLALLFSGPPRRYVGLIDQFSLAHRRGALARHELMLADPRLIGGRPVDTAGFAEAAAQSIVEALRSIGRNATRSGFVTALRERRQGAGQPTIVWR